MPNPRHVPWNKGDAAYSGDFDFQAEGTATISGDTKVDAEVEAGHICFIYLLNIVTTAVDWGIEIYRTSARGNTPIFSKSGFAGDQEITNDLICYVDEDGGSDIHVRFTGADGDSFDYDLHMVRFP
jgi:hypothetical protein